LDIGCARGEYLLRVRERYPSLAVSGVEPSPIDARYARESFSLDVANTTIEEADLPDRSFDLVTLFHVLEHVQDPPETLRRVRRLLAPDGVLVVEVPNMALSRLPLPLGRSILAPGYHNPEHLWHFTPPTLRRLLERQGYQVQRTMARNLGLYPWIDIVALRAPGAWWPRAYFSAMRVATSPLSLLAKGLSLFAIARPSGSAPSRDIHSRVTRTS
jgi:SAM-dependent methyltransferase